MSEKQGILRINKKIFFLPIILTALTIIIALIVSNKYKDSTFNQGESSDIISKFFKNYEVEEIEVVPKGSEIIYQDHSKGIFSTTVGEINIIKNIIPINDDESLAASISPNSKYIVYTKAKLAEGGIITEESPVVLYSYKDNSVNEIFTLPNNSTFAGTSYWDQNEKYFYFTVRSNQEDLHFSDPDTTLYYLYDIDEDKIKYLARGSDFSRGHSRISRESEDGKYFYLETTTHGDPTYLGLWKVNKSTLTKTRLFNSNGENYYYGGTDSEEKYLFLTKYLDQNQLNTEIYKLNLESGLLTKTALKLGYSLPNFVVIDNLLYTEDKDGIEVFDIGTGENVDKITLFNNPNYEFRISKRDDSRYLGVTIYGIGVETEEKVTGGNFRLDTPVQANYDLVNKELIITRFTSRVEDYKPNDVYVLGLIKPVQPNTISEEKIEEEIKNGVYTNYTYGFRFEYPKKLLTDYLSQNGSVYWDNDPSANSPLELDPKAIGLNLLVLEDSDPSYDFTENLFEEIYTKGETVISGKAIVREVKSKNIITHRQVMYEFSNLPEYEGEHGFSYVSMWKKVGIPVIKVELAASSEEVLTKYKNTFTQIVKSFKFID